MKIQEGYLLRNIADTSVVVPIGERVIDFKGMMVLNEVSAAVWGFLSEDRTKIEVLDFILENFDVDKATAEADLDILISQMESAGVIEA